jgi:hypothetical protein
MNVDNFKDNIQDAGKNLKEQHKEITAENATQYKAVKDNNEIEESRTRQQVDKYESDRMGQGGASKLAMETLDKVTLGLTGDRIGAPDKDAPRSMIVDKGSYEKATNNKIGKR